MTREELMGRLEELSDEKFEDLAPYLEAGLAALTTGTLDVSITVKSKRARGAEPPVEARPNKAWA
ncbi:MAG: hypothetical protein HY791_14105 [Deltaproteobacteria bacterium]|nr:hypothetical protein [Deltaproteobacteria bacterium]